MEHLSPESILQGFLPGEIIVSAQNGNYEAFSVLYRMHKKMVHSLCLRLTRNPVEAEDMSQEVFLHLLRVLPSYRHEAEFATWLHRVIVNVVLEKLRLKRIATVSIDERFESHDGGESSLQCGTEDIRIAGAANRIAIERGMQQMPAPSRLVFLLRDVYGCDHVEIAEVLQTTPRKTRALLHKARLCLRKYLTVGGGHSRSEKNGQ